MRNLLTFFLILFLFNSAFSGIIRVNNSNGISADYSDLQTALDSASQGDTVYLEPSSSNYGTVILRKQVSIYGPGYFLAENSGQQANVNTSKISSLTFDLGSEFSSISGLELTTITFFTGNISVTRCRILTFGAIRFDGTSNNSNVLLAQNFIEGALTNGTGFQTYTVFFRNNFIDGNANLEPSIVCDFANNILDFSTSSGVQNSIFVNNIFRNTSGSYDPALGTYNNGFENNLFASSAPTVDTALGNVKGVSMTSIFQLGTNTTDGQFQIIPGSLADDTGKEIPAGTPTDIGIYGGPNPYKLGGVPAIPTIYDLVVPTSNTTGGLNVTIRAKSQD